MAQRILVSYILYSLYTPHPITINPFKSVLFNTFSKEKDQSIAVANRGGVSENEQLVWVLWKILRGDGNDVSALREQPLTEGLTPKQIGPYSPSTMARSPLPPKLKAANLTLDENIYKVDNYDTYAYVSH